MKQDEFLNNKYAETVHDFIGVNRLHRGSVEKSIEKLGLHRSQHIMLVCIKRSGAPVTQKEIAAALEISPAAVTATVKKLETDGLVTRSSDEGDGRCNKIEITDKGREILEESKHGFNEIDTAMFAGFTDSEVEDFKAYLERMKDNLKKIAPQGGEKL